MLDIYLNTYKFPELDEFTAKNKKILAQDALKDLKNRLWNTYKKFPKKIEGWPVARKAFETGFRKLIVTGDGRLDIVML